MHLYRNNQNARRNRSNYSRHNLQYLDLCKAEYDKRCAALSKMYKSLEMFKRKKRILHMRYVSLILRE